MHFRAVFTLSRHASDEVYLKFICRQYINNYIQKKTKEIYLDFGIDEISQIFDLTYLYEP